MQERGSAGDAGAAMTEFVIVIIPMLLLVLGLMQVAQAFAASLVVRHAALCAARSAAVVLAEGDTPAAQRPDDEPPAAGTPYRFGTGEGGAADYAGDARYEAVREAAAFAVTPVASPLDEAVREEAAALVARVTGGASPRSAGGALEGRGETARGGVLARATPKYAYALEATAVVFPDAAAAGAYRSRFANGDLVRVRVTFLFRCAMPLVSALVCRGWADLPEGARADLAATPAGPREMFRGYTLGRYLALTAESALPLQGRADAAVDEEDDPDES